MPIELTTAGIKIAQKFVDFKSSIFLERLSKLGASAVGAGDGEAAMLTGDFEPDGGTGGCADKIAIHHRHIAIAARILEKKQLGFMISFLNRQPIQKTWLNFLTETGMAYRF